VGGYLCVGVLCWYETGRGSIVVTILGVWALGGGFACRGPLLVRDWQRVPLIVTVDGVW
jgi:hypothetical protein